MVVAVTVAWSSVILIVWYQMERQTDRSSITVKCCLMVMQNGGAVTGL